MVQREGVVEKTLVEADAVGDGEIQVRMISKESATYEEHPRQLHQNLKDGGERNQRW